jgi:pentatricopeptide repeat protein
MRIDKRFNKILVIDDDKDIRASLERILKRTGYKVWSVDNGFEGMRILKTENIDLILLDIKLPGIDGGQVLDKVKALKPRTQVIMITNYGDISDAVTKLKRGAFDYLEKPLSKNRLLRRIERALRKRQLLLDKVGRHLSSATKAHREGKPKEAIEEYEKVLQGGIKEPETLSTLRDLYIEKGKYEEAIRLAKEIHKLEPQNIENLRKLGLSQYMSEDFKDAAKTYHLILERSPGKEDKEALEMLAEIFLLEENYKEAKNYFLKVLDLEEEEEYFPGVIERAEKLLDIDNNLSGVHLTLIRAYERQGLQKEAIEEYAKLLNLYLKDGQLRKAEEILSEMVKLDSLHRLTKENGERIKEIRRNLVLLIDDPNLEIDFKEVNLLHICPDAQCTKKAEREGLAFRYIKPEEICDICARHLGERIEKTLLEKRAKLKGRNILVVGGMSPEAYKKQLQKIGVGNIDWHDGVSQYNQIEGKVSRADGVIIVDGAAKHRGTDLAQDSAEKYKKPYARVHQIGASSIVRCALRDLAPQL